MDKALQTKAPATLVGVVVSVIFFSQSHVATKGDVPFEYTIPSVKVNGGSGEGLEKRSQVRLLFPAGAAASLRSDAPPPSRLSASSLLGGLLWDVYIVSTRVSLRVIRAALPGHTGFARFFIRVMCKFAQGRTLLRPNVTTLLGHKEGRLSRPSTIASSKLQAVLQSHFFARQPSLELGWGTHKI